MKTAKIVTACIWLFIQAPISLYLTYKILTMVGATELMMFLFWVYTPLTVVIGTILKLLSDKGLDQ